MQKYVSTSNLIEKERYEYYICLLIFTSHIFGARLNGGVRLNAEKCLIPLIYYVIYSEIN
jgi:hypothetical protein